MATIREMLKTAVQHHQAGRFQDAERLYRKILQAQPNNPDAIYYLGVLAHQMGRLEIAAEYIGRAIRLKGNEFGFHYTLGNVLRNQGKLDEAAASYRRALKFKPDFVDAHNNLGNVLRNQGKLDEAAACFVRALELAPNFAGAHNNLGNVLRNQGKLDEAAACYRLALELKPDFAEAHNDLGSTLMNQGKLDEAVACYRRALALKPDFAEVHNSLGIALMNQGKLDEAVACYRRALALKLDYAEAHRNLGNALTEQGKLDEAVACYCRALELKPDFAEAHRNLGNALMEQGKLDEAVACYRRALELKPDFAAVHSNLGNALTEQGKVDEAVACCRRALELRPDFAEAYCNLGNALIHQNKLDEAVACYRRALDLKPDFAEAHSNLGSMLVNQGKLDEAVACYRRALELKPDCAEVHSNLGNTLRDQDKLDEAVACHRRALELKPDYAVSLGSLVHELQQMCDWKDLKALSQRVIEFVDRDAGGRIVSSVSPFFFLSLPTVSTAEQQLRCARRRGQLKTKCKPGEASKSKPVRDPKSKITIGYLSADFHSHATAWLAAELFEKHDRDRFAIFGYSYGPDDYSSMRRRLVNGFDRFVDVKDISFAETARRITEDKVDILVDLKGYTRDARTQILALRPAPVQVNYLGFPGTMGAPFMDYILVDDYVVPADQQPFFAEKLVHLPGCYQVNDSRREISSRTPSRSECGLPEDGIVLCCFNNNYKITPEIFGIWMGLLKAVPGSVLWLLEGSRFAPANLRQEAASRGIEAQRLVFAPRMPPPEHLARHRLADLFLDTFPCNAHTTASDALWAGCPVLTLSGQTFASRVAGSLLRALGLPELITTSFEDYEGMALLLARDRGRLGALRSRLEANRKTAGLFDGGRFARNIEKAYATMWEIYASGAQPRAFAVSES